MSKQYIFKIIIIGDSYTGKSTIFRRFSEDNIESNIDYKSTIGVDFKTKELTICKKNIKLHLWDTAGQEKFNSVISSFYRCNDCVIFCYDTTNLTSFNNILKWMNNFDKYNNNKNIVKILIGNKNDVISEKKVSYEDGLNFANKNDMKFFEISAINENEKEIDVLLNIITGFILDAKEINNQEVEENKIDKESIILHNENYKKSMFSNIISSFCS